MLRVTVLESQQEGFIAAVNGVSLSELVLYVPNEDGTTISTTFWCNPDPAASIDGIVATFDPPILLTTLNPSAFPHSAAVNSIT